MGLSLGPTKKGINPQRILLYPLGQRHGVNDRAYMIQPCMGVIMMPGLCPMITVRLRFMLMVMRLGQGLFILVAGFLVMRITGILAMGAGRRLHIPGRV
jgi:hypothetical protein